MRDVVALSRVQPRVDVLGTTRNVVLGAIDGVRGASAQLAVLSVVLFVTGYALAGLVVMFGVLAFNYPRPKRGG